jgi:calcineurin-like phosphoesterase family protein
VKCWKTTINNNKFFNIFCVKTAVKIFIVFIVSLSAVFTSCSLPLSRNTDTSSSTQTGVTVGGDDFSIIALPDTQYYSQSYPQIFLAQTQWIAQNAKNQNIIFVTHSGDIVNNYNDNEQWQFAKIAMKKLDGVVPYGLLPGNHDQQTELFNQYFSWTDYANYDWYKGHFDDTNDNNYQIITAGATKLLFIQLQFSPTPEIVDWADNVIDSNRDCTVILNTHSVLYTDGNYTSEGKKLIPLIEEDENLRIVLCGHNHGEALKTVVSPRHETYVMLADYQKLEKGGDGYLRILTFQPKQKKLLVSTYSPYTKKYLTDEDSRFMLDFP